MLRHEHNIHDVVVMRSTYARAGAHSRFLRSRNPQRPRHAIVAFNIFPRS